MFEAPPKLGALLAGSRVRGLIGKIIDVRRANNEEVKNERPRILVTGARIQVEICQICMGRIKEGTEYVRCGSGKVFHSVCLTRMNGCPYCTRTFAIKGKESTTSREVLEPLALAPVVRDVAPVAEDSTRCPVCGEALEKDESGCRACGAIFVADGGMFSCPACGTMVKETDAICSNCGEPFRPFTPQTCPACGRPVTPSSERCQCGAILGDRCPECGALLGETDSECTNCGAVFEFI